MVKTQPEAAWQDLEACHRLKDCLGGRTLVSAMVGVAMGGLYVNTVGESIAGAVWNDVQLERIQNELGGLDFLSVLAHGIRADRAASVQFLTLREASRRNITEDLDVWFRLIPSGWLCQNECLISQQMQSDLDALDRRNNTLVSSSRIDSFHASLPTPYNFMALSYVPNFLKARETTARIHLEPEWVS